MKHSESKALKQLAAKYVWWKTPDEAMAWPDRVIAQVMDMGDYADVQILANQLGDDRLSDVLAHAQAGQFGERAWATGLLSILTFSHPRRWIEWRCGAHLPSWRNPPFCKTNPTL